VPPRVGEPSHKSPERKRRDLSPSHKSPER
jgi:hypothetical protein